MTDPIGEETVRVTLRLSKSLASLIDDSAFCFDISRNTAICRALSVDFYGQLAIYERVAAASRVEAAREEAAQQLEKIGLRSIVKENFR